MFLLSPLIDLASRVGGPRFAHQVYLHRLERWRTYEPEFYMLDHLVDPTRAAVDVGANEGIYSGRLAQLCKHVHCFEPIPWFADEIRRKLGDSIRVHQSALSNRAGDGELRIPYRGDVEMHGTSTLEVDNPLAGSTSVKPIPCKLERLDDAVPEPVGFIKIDVEGHELSVLEGAARILRVDRPVLLIESDKRHNKDAPENIFRLLSTFGYGGFFVDRHRMMDLSAFDPLIHQRPENFRSASQPFVFNFIFLPGKAPT